MYLHTHPKQKKGGWHEIKESKWSMEARIFQGAAHRSSAATETNREVVKTEPKKTRSKKIIIIRKGRWGCNSRKSRERHVTIKSAEAREGDDEGEDKAADGAEDGPAELEADGVGLGDDF
jgi:hypothetical protein